MPCLSKIWDVKVRIALGLCGLACALLCACNRNSYEVIERSEKEVPNFMAEGTHNEVHYVLLHDGHKIYANCDVHDLNNLDPNARCGFRPLHTYQCELGSDSFKTGTMPMSDLKCKDADGNNVYLYVTKKE